VNKRQKKIRARARSQRYAAEKVMDALANGPYPHTTDNGVHFVLRHGKTWKPDEPNHWYGKKYDDDDMCGCGSYHR
jgi:hypothetical protein